MGMTKDQLNAVNSEGNVLVSAGAGSGKTTVLTNRVIKKINEGTNLDEFLILTFTVAAANEMRERIKVNLIKYDKNELINLVDSAHIETFDAFALFIVKKYGHVINLPSNISIVPQDVIEEKIYSVETDIFQELYKNHDEVFADLIYNYCIKDDKKIKDFVRKFYEVANNSFDFDDFVDNYADRYLSDEFLLSRIDEFFKGIQNQIKKLKNLIDNIPFKSLQEKYLNYYSELFSSTSLEECIEIYTNLGRFPSFTVSKGEELDTDTEALKEGISNIRKTLVDCINFDVEIYKKIDIPNQQKFMKLIIKIIKEMNERIHTFEVSVGYFTFSEISSYAFKILLNHEEIREEVKSKFKYIFIDEYQDTSELQQKFINMIANNNVFKVGDVKQSIYLFRNANPDNFSIEYDEYKKKKQLIDMNDNFRSREEIVTKINEIFNRIMTSKYGGADYSVSHNLKASNTAYEKIGHVKGKHGIFKIQLDEKEDAITAIAQDIKKRISSGQEIYDREEGRVRKVTYKDFAIISPYGGRFPKYEEELRKLNIPVTAIYDETIFNDDSVIVLASLLKLITLFNKTTLTNIDQKDVLHYYISVVRSFLFEYSDDQIYHMIIDKTYDRDDVFTKIKTFAFQHKYSSLLNTYIDLLNEFDFIYKLKLLNDSFSSLDKLEVFYERLNVMNDLGYNLQGFVKYITSLKEIKVEMKERHDEAADDAITMTTVHKSKGLQYKIVYLIEINQEGLNSKTNEIDLVNMMLDCFSSKSNHTIDEDAAILQNTNKHRQEKMRLLYVALTRTEDTCIIVYPYINSDKVRVIADVADCKNFYSLLEFSRVEFEDDEYLSMDKVDTLEEKPIDIAKEQICFSKINESFEKTNSKFKASKDIDLTVDISKLNFGTHMHLLMQEVDFITKDTSFIINKYEHDKITRILNNKLFSKCKDASIYKEYMFYDRINEINGVIDLLMIYEDHCVIVDYKLKNIDDESYNKQLNIYKAYVHSTFKKPVECFLLSLIDDEIREV